MKNKIMKNNSILESVQNGNNRCCYGIPKYKVTYFHGSTWLVCSKCCDHSIWNNYIKSKTKLV